MAGVLERLGFRVLQIRPYAALDTLECYGGWRVPRHLKDALAFGLDYMPVIRNWGSTCIWVAQKSDWRCPGDCEPRRSGGGPPEAPDTASSSQAR